MIRKLSITAVEDGIKPGIFCDTGFEVIWYQEPGHAIEILVSMCVAEQPVFRFHVAAKFCIRITAAGEYSDEL